MNFTHNSIGAPFITGHLGKPIASAAVLGAIGNRFRRDGKRFADAQEIPILMLQGRDRSRWDDRKLDHVRPYLDAAERERRFGVVAIVAGQEFAWVFSARTHGKGKALWFEFFREQRRVGVYYFYVLDPDFGPGFIKICTYFPYPARVWINGAPVDLGVTDGGAGREPGARPRNRPRRRGIGSCATVIGSAVGRQA
jgi:hypothetical protein